MRISQDSDGGAQRAPASHADHDWSWCPSCHERWRADLAGHDPLAACPLCDGPVVPWSEAVLAELRRRHAA